MYYFIDNISCLWLFKFKNIDNGFKHSWPPFTTLSRYFFNILSLGLLRSLWNLVWKVAKSGNTGREYGSAYFIIMDSLHWRHLLAKPSATATRDSHYSTCLGNLGKYHDQGKYQGDQIGRNFAIWAIFYGVGRIFFVEKVAQWFWWNFSHEKIAQNWP